MAVQISGNDITVPRDGTFTRNVTIGGTLTYEDVTNIDSVGLITARNGIEIGARPGVAASISVDGNMIVSGISTFGGNVTVPGLTATSYLSVGDDDNINLGDGNDLKIYHQSSDNNSYIENDTGNLIIRADAANKDITLQAADLLAFNTGGANERARIDSSGRLLLGHTAVGSKDASSPLQVQTANSGAFAITIRNRSSNNDYGFIGFTDDDADEDLCQIGVQRTAANTGDIFFYTNGGASGSTERLRIKSDGKVGINEASPSEALQIDGDILLGGQANSGTANYALKFEYNNHQFAKIVGNGRDSSGYGDIDFYTSSGSGVSNLNQRMTIREAGNVGINVADPDQRLEVDGIIKGSSYIQTGASGTNTNNFHFGAEGDGSFRLYWKNYGAGDERLRIIPSGTPVLKFGGTTNTDIYNTSGTGNEGAWLVAGGASQFAASNSVVMRMNRKTYNGKIVAFYYNGSEVGNIQTNSNSLPSDKNFKKNISDLNLGLSLVNKLKPSQFNFKVDEPNTPVMYGLIAQELEESLISEGVTKNSTQLIQHNPTDNDKESDYDVDYLKLTPVLINAIKELSAEVEQLKSQLNN